MKTAVFGGDKRMLFAARAFADEGHEVYIAGFDHLKSLCEIRVCGYEEAAKNCDIAVLPVRPQAGECLHTPYSADRINMAHLTELIAEKPIFSGCADKIQPFAAGKVYDYAVEESFVLKNAVLTAEGAVGILINGYEGAVSNSEILVTGYGRIGRHLSALLKALGAEVTVAARRQADLSLIAQRGFRALAYPSVDYSAYQVIMNTVPAAVMDKTAVDAMRDDVFIVDLASAPGGVDEVRAEERGLSLLRAPGLPGKTAPLAAGTIIKDTVLDMLSRENYVASSVC